VNTGSKIPKTTSSPIASEINTPSPIAAMLLITGLLYQASPPARVAGFTPSASVKRFDGSC
jgi:hypothetical protein